MGNLFGCLPSWEEALQKTKKARRIAERSEEDYKEDVANLRTRAENALLRGDEETALTLMQEASRKRRRGARSAALRNDAEDTSDYIQQSLLKSDLMTAREAVSIHIDDKLKKKKKSPAKEGQSFSNFDQEYKNSDEAFKVGTGLDSSEEEEKDDVDKEWVDQNLSNMRLKVEEQKIEANARAARKAVATKTKKITVKNASMI